MTRDDIKEMLIRYGVTRFEVSEPSSFGNVRVRIHDPVGSQVLNEIAADLNRMRDISMTVDLVRSFSEDAVLLDVIADAEFATFDKQCLPDKDPIAAWMYDLAQKDTLVWSEYERWVRGKTTRTQAMKNIIDALIRRDNPHYFPTKALAT